MSESTTGKRIGAMRTARRFPVLFGMVARGEIHLSGIHRLKSHLTPENHERVLIEAKFKTIRQIEELASHRSPMCLPDCEHFQTAQRPPRHRLVRQPQL